ncbi:MAG TPA: CYTH and CHAD domain-containing protein [Acidimicrobiales bacterium]|nr:CYTH and CHAD domain-containing protein [Acidimicrobiales bacterium]
MADRALEVETKLSAGADLEMPDLSRLARGAAVERLPAQSLETVYFDTRDLRLARAGISLRCRRGEGLRPRGQARWTVKLPALDGRGGDTSAVARREVTVEAPDGAVPDELAFVVRGVARSALLGPVAVLRSERARWLVSVGERAAVEVDDDRVEVLEGGRVVATFREIEVERVGEDEPSGEMAAQIVEGLRAAGAAASGPTSKIARALGADAVGGAEVAPVDVSPRSSMGEVVRAAVASATIRLFRHDAPMRLGDDPEDVHQARVATRRLRSDLRTFGSVLDRETTRHLRDELGWLGGVLGRHRDADVLFERLHRHSAALPPADARAAARLLEKLAGEREEARVLLVEALDSDRYLAVLDALVHAARQPPLLPEAGEPAARVLSDAVERQWKKLARTVEALDDDPPFDALHQVRISAKRVRYAAEAAEPVCGKRARRLAKSLAALQGVLGELNDAVTAEAWLRAAAARSSGASAVAAGQLVAAEREAQLRAVREWPRAWKDAVAERRRWRS